MIRALFEENLQQCSHYFMSLRLKKPCTVGTERSGTDIHQDYTANGRSVRHRLGALFIQDIVKMVPGTFNHILFLTVTPICDILVQCQLYSSKKDCSCYNFSTPPSLTGHTCLLVCTMPSGSCPSQWATAKWKWLGPEVRSLWVGIDNQNFRKGRHVSN